LWGPSSADIFPGLNGFDSRIAGYYDEYTTFFAHTRSNLNRVVKSLVGDGFKMIPD
jgi:hypothetical protein